MSEWDRHFNGSYDTSRYADLSVEEKLERFIDKGELTYARPDGELIRELPTRIDVWGVGDDEGNYDHWYYNGPDDYGKAPDGRHSN